MFGVNSLDNPLRLRLLLWMHLRADRCRHTDRCL